MRGYLIALSYLSTLPVDLIVAPTKEEIAASRGWFPWVGLFLGLLLAGMLALGMVLWTPLVAAFLTLAAWVLLTGGLHLDGLSDLADALAGGNSPADRLKILKDPHVGNFGILAIGLALLGKLAALHDLILGDSAAPLLAVIGAVVTGRCLLTVLAGGSRYPRPRGTGKVIIEATKSDEVRFVLIVTALVAALTAFGDFSFLNMWWFCLLWALPLLAVLRLRQVCVEQLGGVTGDCLGASIELVETLFLILAAMAL